jgi:hypothetical protein
MVGRELGFEALRGEPAGRVHHPGVVDEHVHRDPVSQDRRGEGPHRVQIGEIQCPEFDGRAWLRGHDPGDSDQGAGPRVGRLAGDAEPTGDLGRQQVLPAQLLAQPAALE